MSGPYQSNILRFLVGQYHSGVERHRQAVRKTRAAAIFGVEVAAEVGMVLAMTPVYAAVRVSQSAGRKLRQPVTKQRLSATFSKVAGRLRAASGGEQLAARSQLLISNHAKQTGDVEQKATAGLARTISNSIVRVISRSAVRVSDIVRITMGRLVTADENEVAIAPSCIQTTDLQSDNTLSNQKKGSLVRPTLSFWVAVLEAVANLKSRWKAKRLKSAFAALPPHARSNELPISQQSRRLKADAVTATLLICSDSVGSLRPALEAQLSAAATDSLEAKVTAFEYVEHPLETALRWIDRILSWLETQWKLLAEVWYRWLARTQHE
jgi:hypothetical protein